MRIRLAAGRSRGMNTSAATMASGATITLIPNAHRHVALVVRIPPSTGPRARPTPTVAPHAPNAVARSRPWNVVDRIDNVAGSMSDAPMPSINASPTMRLGTFHESAARSDPPQNNAAPITKMRRWPYTSPRRPPMMRRLAKVSA